MGAADYLLLSSKANSLPTAYNPPTTPTNHNLPTITPIDNRLEAEGFVIFAAKKE